MKPVCGFLVLFSLITAIPSSALPPEIEKVATKSALTSYVVQPTRVVWKSAEGVSNSENLLIPKSGQAVLIEPSPPLVVKPGAGIVLDFGIEITGSVELFTPMTKEKDMPSVRIRFGESVAETMAEIGERGAHRTTTPFAIRW
jgi:alpha-L-rhamnosidase